MMTTQNNTLPTTRKPLDLRRFLDDWVMLLAAVGIFVNGGRDCIQKVLVAERLGKEIGCSRLHRPDTHGDVSEPRHKHYGHSAPDTLKIILEV